MMVQAPILHHFDPNRPAFLETDASDCVIAGILSQDDDDGRRHPVAFWSRRMTGPESRYDIHDKEMLAIIGGLKEWRPELEGSEHPIEILSDHKGLEYFMTKKELSKRQGRWADEVLCNYNFVIKYRRGTLNAAADAMTRQGGPHTHKKDERVLLPPELVLRPVRPSPEPESEPEDSSDGRPATPEETDFLDRLRAATKEDRQLMKLIRKESERNALEETDTEDEAPERRYEWKDGLVWQTEPGLPAILVPTKMITEVIRECHAKLPSGHPGIGNTQRIVLKTYRWTGMRQHIAQYVRNCDVCKRTKVHRQSPYGLLHPLPLPQQPWTDIAMDLIVGLPITPKGNNAVFTVVDRFSKMKHYIPCLAKDEQTGAPAWRSYSTNTSGSCTGSLTRSSPTEDPSSCQWFGRSSARS